MAYRRGAMIVLLGLLIIFVAVLLLVGHRPISINCEPTSPPFGYDCARSDIYGVPGLLGMILGFIILIIGVCFIANELLEPISEHSCPRCGTAIDLQCSPTNCYNCGLPIDWSKAKAPRK